MYELSLSKLSSLWLGRNSCPSYLKQKKRNHHWFNDNPSSMLKRVFFIKHLFNGINDILFYSAKKLSAVWNKWQRKQICQAKQQMSANIAYYWFLTCRECGTLSTQGIKFNIWPDMAAYLYILQDQLWQGFAASLEKR